MKNLEISRDIFDDPSVHGAFFFIENPRCGWVLSYILRRGSVRFIKRGDPTVRFRVVFLKKRCYSVVRCGFLEKDVLQCGSVRFSEIRKPTVRSGAVFRYRRSYGAIRCLIHPTVLVDAVPR